MPDTLELPLTYEEWLHQAILSATLQLRPGQHLFTQLHRAGRLDLALAAVNDPRLDPYYDNLNIPAFLTYVREHWVVA